MPKNNSNGLNQICGKMKQMNQTITNISLNLPPDMVQGVATGAQNVQNFLIDNSQLINFEGIDITSLGNISINDDFTEFTVSESGLYEIVLNLTFQNLNGGLSNIFFFTTVINGFDPMVMFMPNSIFLEPAGDPQGRDIVRNQNLVLNINLNAGDTISFEGGPLVNSINVTNRNIMMFRVS